MSLAIVGDNYIDDDSTYLYVESQADNLTSANLKDRQITKVWRTADQPASGDYHIEANPTISDWIELGRTDTSVTRFTFVATGSSNVASRQIRIMSDVDDTVGEIWYVLNQYANGSYSGNIDDLEFFLGGQSRTWNPPTESIASGPQTIGDNTGPSHNRHLHFKLKDSLGTENYPGDASLPYGNGFYYTSYGDWQHGNQMRNGHIGSQTETAIQLEFSGQRLVDALSLINHNFTGGAQWRVRFSTDLSLELEAFPNKTYNAITKDWHTIINNWGYKAQTMWKDVWPSIGQFGTLPWGVFLWGTNISSEQLESYKPFSSHLLLDDPIYAKFIRIDIKNTSAQEYFEIGRVVVGHSWRPTRNMSRNWQLTYKDPSKITRSLGGQTYVDTLSKYRQVKFTLKYITEDEIFENALELDRIKGSSGDVLIYTDTQAPTHKLFKQTIYGRISKISPMKHNIGGYWTRSYDIEELL